MLRKRFILETFLQETSGGVCMILDKVKTHFLQFDEEKPINEMYCILVLLLPTIVLIYFQNIYISILYSLLLVALFKYFPMISAIVWLALLPFELLFRNSGILSPYLTLLFLAFYYLAQLFYRRGIRVSPRFLGWFVMIGFLSLFSALANPPLLLGIRNVISLGTVLFMITFIYILWQNDKRVEKSIINTIFITTLIASVFAVFLKTGVRVGLGDNIRSFSNILGLSSMLLFNNLINMFKNKPFSTDYFRKMDFNSNINIFMFIYCLVFLLLTVSRGVILAVAIGIIVYFMTHLLMNFSKKVLKQMIVGFSSLIVGVLILSQTYLFDLIGGDILVKRFTQGIVDNVRFEFWSYALSKLEGIQFFFGYGLNSFRSIVKAGGYEYYAHSIFIDVLISIGFIGFLFFVSFILHIIYKAFINRNIFLVSFSAYTFFSFFTHGNLFSKYFWLHLLFIVLFSQVLPTKLLTKGGVK